jgi:hypothetical protein
MLKSIDAEYKSFYYGKLLLAQHEIRPAYCILFLYMSFFLFSRINEDSVQPLFSTEWKRNTAKIHWVPLDILYWSGVSSSNKNQLGWEEGMFFSVNNNPRHNTWTSLLEELDGISEFHCSCFSEKRVFILVICVGKWGRGWNTPQLAAALSPQCLLCTGDRCSPHRNTNSQILSL